MRLREELHSPRRETRVGDMGNMFGRRLLQEDVQIAENSSWRVRNKSVTASRRYERVRVCRACDSSGKLFFELSTYLLTFQLIFLCQRALRRTEALLQWTWLNSPTMGNMRTERKTVLTLSPNRDQACSDPS